MLQNFGSELARNWAFDPEYIYLNHGAFGAAPIFVLEKQAYLRFAMENQPARFLTRELEEQYLISKSTLANFIDAENDDVVFVPCATHGVNTVLKSLDFKEGDEIITTNHEYFACKNALDFVAKKAGVKVLIAEIPFPIDSPNIITERLVNLISEKTKLLLVDHITSPSALVLPMKKIVEEFRKRNIEVLVDGAHAAGMIDLSIKEINPTYYTGNCHKWICSAKGSAFLYVEKDKQEKIHPLSTSHVFVNNSNSPYAPSSWTPFQTEFYWCGTYDPTPYISVGIAIAFMRSLVDGGWKEIREHNRNLVLEGRNILCDMLNISLPCPEEMIGSIASIPLPDIQITPPLPRNYIDPLQNILYNDHKIEVPVHYLPKSPNRVIRISAQLYNATKQYEILSDVLKKSLQ